MPRTLLSFVVALASTVVGLPLLWIGGALAIRSLDVSGDAASTAAIGPALLALLGAAILGVGGYSIRWSSLGALVAGGLHLVVSATALAAAPFDDDALPFLWRLVFDVDRLNRELSSGLAMTLAYGVSALLGVALVVAGVTSLRPRPTTVLWRVLGAVGGVCAIVVTVWALTVGLRVYIAFLVAVDPVPSVVAPLVVQLALLVLALGVALVPLLGSTLGAWIAGIVITGLGLLLIAPLPEILGALPADLAFLVVTIGPSGFLSAIGLTLLGIAAGSRRRRSLEPPAAPVG